MVPDSVGAVDARAQARAAAASACREVLPAFILAQEVRLDVERELWRRGWRLFDDVGEAARYAKEGAVGLWERLLEYPTAWEGDAGELLGAAIWECRREVREQVEADYRLRAAARYVADGAGALGCGAERLERWDIGRWFARLPWDDIVAAAACEVGQSLPREWARPTIADVRAAVMVAGMGECLAVTWWLDHWASRTREVADVLARERVAIIERIGHVAASLLLRGIIRWEVH
jgi:hypothetical protein